MTEHKPGLHCHHDVLAVECTMCTYLAMEKLHDMRILDLIEEETGETTQRAAEAGETGQSAGLDDPTLP
jgi:hypothetical protein